MTEFIGEVNIGQKLKKQTVRVEDRNISAIGPAECSAQSPVIRVAEGRTIVNLAYRHTRFLVEAKVAKKSR